MRRLPRISAGLVATAAMAAVCSCGGAEPDPSDGRASDRTATTFAVTRIPEDRLYELTLASTGATHPAWGDDSVGSDEPLVVLGEPGREDPETGTVVVVSATGYAGYEGGFDQASAAYAGGGEADALEVDGHEALYTSATGRDDSEHPSNDEVLVDEGGGRAIRVTGLRTTRQVLLDVAARARLADGPDGTAEPVVDDPPEGLAVLSRANVDLVVALGSAYWEACMPTPGTSRSFAVGYRASSTEPEPWLLALSVPGGEDSLLAARFVSQPGETDIEPVEVAGRAGLVITTEFGPGGEAFDRRLVTTSADGSLLIVTGRPPLATNQLATIAGGVRSVDEQAWSEQSAKGVRCDDADEGGRRLTTTVPA